MSTTHEYDAYCDAIGHEPEPDYYEQCCVMEEFEDAREDALKRQGAKEALVELKSHLRCEIVLHDFCGSNGADSLRLVLSAIDRRLADLEPVEGGAL